MREHSNSGQNPRLPWEYDAATNAVGDQFLQLREELVPYLYTLADQAYSTGLPMTQALYLDYPGQAAAYTNPDEYLLGPDVLVDPVTQPGASVATQVWFPPGTWEDYFTGATFTGPGHRDDQRPDQPHAGLRQGRRHHPAAARRGQRPDRGHRADHPPGPRRRERLLLHVRRRRHRPRLPVRPVRPDPDQLHRERFRGNVDGDDRPRHRLLRGRAEQPHLHDRPGRRVAADLGPAQRPDPRLLRLELQQRRPHAPGPGRRGRAPARPRPSPRPAAPPSSWRSRPRP